MLDRFWFRLCPIFDCSKRSSDTIYNKTRKNYRQWECTLLIVSYECLYCSESMKKTWGTIKCHTNYTSSNVSVRHKTSHAQAHERKKFAAKRFSSFDRADNVTEFDWLKVTTTGRARVCVYCNSIRSNDVSWTNTQSTRLFVDWHFVPRAVLTTILRQKMFQHHL